MIIFFIIISLSLLIIIIMFEINFDDEPVINDEIIDTKKKELYNRNNVYLEVLNKRLKKFEYLKKHDIHMSTFSSSDNSFLEEHDYSIIEHSEKYTILSNLNKNDTIILKQLLEQKLSYDKIFTSSNVDKYIVSDQENYEALCKIKLRYMGFKTIYQSYESIDNKMNDFDYIYCLDKNVRGCLLLKRTFLYVFKVIKDNFDKEYIFYSDNSRIFYKTDEFIKLDYIPIDNYEFQLEITKKINNHLKFKFLDFENNNVDSNKYLKKENIYVYYGYDYNHIIKSNDDLNELYTKNILIKGIHK